MDALPCKDALPGSDELVAYSNDASKLALVWGSSALARVLKTTVWQGCGKIFEHVQVSKCRVQGFRVQGRARTCLRHVHGP